MRAAVNEAVKHLDHEGLKIEYIQTARELEVALDEVEALKAQMLELDTSLEKHPKALSHYLHSLFGDTSKVVTA